MSDLCSTVSFIVLCLINYFTTNIRTLELTHVLGTVSFAVVSEKGHSILRKWLKPKTKSPLSYKEDKGLLPLEWGLDCDHYQLSSNDSPVGNVSRGTSTQHRGRGL